MNGEAQATESDRSTAYVRPHELEIHHSPNGADLTCRSEAFGAGRAALCQTAGGAGGTCWAEGACGTC